MQVMIAGLSAHHMTDREQNKYYFPIKKTNIGIM